MHEPALSWFFSRAFAVAAIALPADGGRITAVQNAPKAPDGFSVELVMEQPEVKWPSAVHCREDGSLLVAEDPMDMPGPTDQPLDRIWLLRFAPDGSFTKTLFAEKLFAVMGLQEIDDAIYVMNMPHLTVLRDLDGDGVAEERTELLTTLGPPAPGWPGGFNDHIVSGIRLGMDGFLYVSVGDKGIPQATARDGLRITLRGGGVVRVRPDGTELEIVASGTRNHLDVAVNEFDHLFTYDNTDDGLGWWTRLTHILPTGYYGYPWDYQAHPERMLPCIKDDGGGSPVGGLVYREDAWPEEFRGDLFYCEWADGVVRRFKLARDGASYQCTLTEDFITAGGSGEFRPLDIAESADGRFLYIADWNFGGWTSPQVAGRVWRVRRTDDRPGAPPIGGLADGTVAARATASLPDLIANLGHPSFRRRLAAQRELEHRAESAKTGEELQRQFEELMRTVARPPAGGRIDPATDRTLRHLLWALARSPGGLPVVTVANALSSPCAELRAQAARAYGQRRGRERPIVKLLTDVMQHDPDLMARREAVIALGRSRETLAVWPLVRALDDNDDRFVRFAQRQAIRAIGTNWGLLLPRVMQHCTPATCEEVWLALRELYELDLVGALAAATTSIDYVPAMRARALLQLAELHRKRPAWDGKWWLTQPARTGWPEKTEAWEGTPVAIDAIRRAFDASLPEVRAAALEATRIAREPELFPSVRARYAKAADDGERATLLALLAEIRDAEAAPLCAAALAAPTAALRATAVSALDRLQGEAALPALERTLADPDAGVRAIALEVFARHPDARRLRDYLGGLALGGTTAERCRQALAALRVELRAEIEGMATRGELDAAALAVVREIYDDPLPLLRWQLIGPLPRDARVAAIESGGRFVPATDEPPPLEVEAAAPHGFVDLDARLGAKDEVAVYALAVLDSPMARTARCTVGSDDGVIVWVNGVLVHENRDDRGWSPDQDRFEIALAAGRNAILLRIEQAGGDWAFNVKVSDVPSGPLFEGAARPAFDVKALRDFALANPGDAERGRALFYAEAGPGCFRCHAIAGVGPKVGPDLRDVGKKYPRAELITSVLEPSQRILDGYAATNVFLVNDDVLSGLVTGEKEGVLSLADANGAVREIPLAEVKERRLSKLSAMAAGLSEKLSPQELADLVAWLETLKQ